MSNHTPGPWIIEGNHILRRGDNGELLRIDSIATVFPCAEGLVRDLPPNTQANANLIASAPELLEMLTLASTELATTIAALNRLTNDEDFHDYQTVNECMLLIEKAKGGP